MKSITLSVVFFFAISKVFSQEPTEERWEYLGQSKGKEKYYIDITNKYKMDDVFGNKEVWVKCLVPVKKLKQNGKTLTYYNAVILTLHELNCSKSEMKIKQEIIYDSKGNLLDSWENDFGSFKKVAPGTIGEMIMEESCKIH